MIAVMIMCGGLFGERETIYSMDPTACSVGWFTSLLVRLREREVLLTGSGEQYSCEGAGQPSQPSDHAVYLCYLAPATIVSHPTTVEKPDDSKEPRE